MKHGILLAVAFCIGILPVIAQTTAPKTTSITLESAVQTALDRNLGVITSQNSLQSAQTATTAAYGSYLPSLNLSGGFNRNFYWRNDPQSTTVINGVPTSIGGASYTDYNNISTGLDASMSFSFAKPYSVSHAEANQQSFEYSLSRMQQTTIYQAHQLFMTVVRNYELMKVSEENIKRDQQQLDRITESNKVGAVALADVYRQQAQVGNDEFSNIQAQNNFEKAKADVLAYLGVEMNQEYSFDFSGIPADIDTTEFAPLNQQYSDFNGLVTAAMNKRPDRLSSLSSLNSAQSSVSAAKAAYLPVFSTSLQYGYSNDAFSTLKDNRSLGFGISVSLPLFNGFQTQTNIQQAQISESTAQEQLAQSERIVTVDIRKALLDLEAAEKEVRVGAASVQSASMDLQIAQEKYNLGSGTLLDLLTAQANYTQAASNKVNAVNDYLLAKKGVEYAMGAITK